MESGAEKTELSWIGVLRLLAVFWILWGDYEVQAFLPAFRKTFLVRMTEQEGGILYGFSGNYALALLALVSGYLTDMHLHRQEPLFSRDMDFSTRKGAGEARQRLKTSAAAFLLYAVRRYLRLMLPVMTVGLLWVLLGLVSGDVQQEPLKRVLAGLFLPGAGTFDPRLFSILYFYLAGLALHVIYPLFGENEKRWTAISCGAGAFGVIFLQMLGNETVWLFAIILGAGIYELCRLIRPVAEGIMLPPSLDKRRKLLWLVMLIPVLLLPGASADRYVLTRQIFSGAQLILFLDLSGTSEGINRLYHRRHVHRLSRLSYSFFVCHSLVNRYAAEPILRRLSLPVGLSYILGMLLMAGLVYLLGSFVWLFSEKTLYGALRGKLTMKEQAGD